MIIYEFPSDYEKISDDFTVEWENRNIDVYSCDVSAYPFNRVWQGKQRSHEQTKKASFISFGSDDEVTLNIMPKKSFQEVVVRPLSKSIIPVVCENSINVTFPGPGQYSVELDGTHNTLTVFINPEKDLFKGNPKYSVRGKN